MNVDLLIKPQGRVLQQFFDCMDRRVFIRGPLGSGKTTMCVLKIIDLICRQHPNHQGVRPSRWFAIRNTYNQLGTTAIKDWLEVCGDLGPYIKGGSTEPPNQKLRFDLDDGTKVESEIFFLALDRPYHIRSVKGLEITGGWLNEAKELQKPIVDEFDLRIGRFPQLRIDGIGPSWRGMIGDYNSPDSDHWLYKLAEVERPEGWSFFHQPGGLMRDSNGAWIQNPAAENMDILEERYYLIGKEGKSEDWIAVNLANEYGFLRTGKPVHPWYQDNIHCMEADYQPHKDRKIVLGFDFGRTPACAFLQQTVYGGWVCFDELTSEDMSAASFAPELRRYIDRHYPRYDLEGWGDPAGDAKGQASESTPMQILRAHGLPCQPTLTNQIEPRRRAVETPAREMGMDGRPRFLVTKKAKMVREGLAGGFCYRRIQVSAERYTEEPDKNEYSHPVEALEYALLGEGEGRVMGKRDRFREKGFGKPDYDKEPDYDDWDLAING